MSSMQMTEAEIEAARKIATECPTGCLIAHDEKTDKVFFKNVHTGALIETAFTPDQVGAAHRLPISDPGRLHFDRVNNAAQTRFAVYRIEGK